MQYLDASLQKWHSVTVNLKSQAMDQFAGVTGPR